jgi:hypothetical protein
VRASAHPVGKIFDRAVEQESRISSQSAERNLVAELLAAGLNVIPCERGPIASTPASSTCSAYRSATLAARPTCTMHTELFVKGEQRKRDTGHEDPKTKNHTMSAVRYGLTMLAGAGTTYDPHQKEGELVQVTVTRRRLSGNQSR